MTNKIIKSNLFEANVTKKTKWIFVKLENDIGVFGWGEATLQGKEKEIFSNSQRIFELILNVARNHYAHNLNIIYTSVGERTLRVARISFVIMISF